jgi:O-antigen/teichoic acid export membrane protein
VTSFRSNLLASFIGTGWATLVQLACVPFYVQLMGIEAYALVGFHMLLLAVLQVFDVGLTTALNREMARRIVNGSEAEAMRNLARTLEGLYWIAGVLVGGAIALLAPYIVEHWVNPESLSRSQVISAISLMGALVALQWPLSLYQNGLLGLQRQVRLSVLRVIFASTSGVGAVLALSLISADIVTFFRWQGIVMAANVTATAIAFRTALPASARPPRIDPGLALRSGRFAAGVAVISLFAMLLTQMDKLVLSKLATLESFGHYVLAGTVASGLSLFVTPLYSAVFPRLSSLVATGDENGVRALYHASSQLLAVLAVPCAAVLALFSFEVLAAWTGDAAMASRSAPILALLAVGSALNGLMHLPYALQLAHGWTRIGVVLTVGQVALFLPLLVLSVQRFGAVGAAAIWMALNAFYLAIGLPWTHRRLLRGDASRWIVFDVGLPAAGAMAAGIVGRLLMPEDLDRWGVVVYLLAVLTLSMLLALAFSTRVRQGILSIQHPVDALP